MGVNFNTNQQQRDDHQQMRRDSVHWDGEGTLPATPTFEDQLLTNGLRYGVLKPLTVNEMLDKKGNFIPDIPERVEKSRTYLDSIRELIKHKDRPTEFGPTNWRK